MSDAAFQSVTDAAGVKVGAALSGFGAVLAWDAPVAILGVPVAVLLAALTGALLGIIYGEPLKTRRFAIGAVVVNTFIAAVAAAIAPHIPLFGWLKSAPMGAVALVLAFAARWAIPILVEHAPATIRAGLAKLGVKLPEPKGDAS